jgi:hypothetical protein
MFKHAVNWLQHSGRLTIPTGRQPNWGILSAKHGLVLPDQVLEPYDVRLSQLPNREQEAWKTKVKGQLAATWGYDCIYLVLMGGDYKSALHGFLVEDPIACWTQWRRDRGMTGRRAAMGIGLILKALKEQHPYY